MHHGIPKWGHDAWSVKLGAHKNGIFMLKMLLCRTLVLVSDTDPQKVPGSAGSRAANAANNNVKV